jgi:uncharacterized protein (TIGR03437 family)
MLDTPVAVTVGLGGVIYVSVAPDLLSVDYQYSRVRALTPPGSSTGSAPSISAGGIVSASAFGGFSAISPGSWIEIYGSNLATDTRSWGGSDFNGNNAPTALDQTSVTIGGDSAFIAYISPTQVNVQVPSNVGTGPQQIIVTTAGVPSAPATTTVNTVEPGLLAPSSFKVNGTQYVAALFSDGSTFVLPPGAISGVTSRRAQPGDTITLYGVGFGSVIPSIPAGQIVQQTNSLAAPFHVFFGQTQAAVTYDGLAPSEVGLYQFNVVVPTIPSSDSVPLTFTLNGASGTQTLYIAVQNGAAAPQVQVQSVTLSQSSVSGGTAVTGTVTLSQSAPTGGAAVALSSSSSSASVPSTLTVPAGATSATFTVSTSSVTSSQTITITATYAGGSTQATLTLKASGGGSSLPPFTAIEAVCTYQPNGYPAEQLILSILPNAGNVTYTASVVSEGPGLTFVNGMASNQTITFASLQQGPDGTSPVFLVGTTSLAVSNASLTFTLIPMPTTPLVGNVSGTLTVTGTPFPSGGATVTIAGNIVGTYSATE